MNAVATKEDIDRAMGAWEEFKTTNDQRIAQAVKGAIDTLTTEKLGRIEKSLDDAEKLNQKLTQDLQQQKNHVDQTLDALELKLSRAALGSQAATMTREERKAELMVKVDAWARAVDKCVKVGSHNLTEDERKLLTDAKASYKSLGITDDTGGGYLAPVDFVPEILKYVVLVSPVRSLARIRTTSLKSVRIPVRTGVPTATWEDETEAPNESQMKYGLLEVFTRKLRAIVDISNDMLDDSAFDMGAEILDEVSLQYAVAEGAAFVSGSGSKQPEGFLVNTAVIASANVTKSGDANNLTADAFVKLFHTLKSAYVRNAVWAMNRQTVGLARQLKDGDGRYLFLMGLPDGTPNTILGSSYVEVPDMPAVAAGAYPVAFGDFYRGYSLVDRLEMTMLGDPYTQADSDVVRYRFRKRLGGAVTMAEAIKPMLISA